MIGWMQNNNKYLVWTIWIATIAFIGAGFVGWGSYSFGSKNNVVAKVGSVEIEKTKFDMTYTQLYTYYNTIFQGQFDDNMAKEMGLLEEAFKITRTQAQLLNLADEFGIIVSNKELAEQLQQIEMFKNNGQFSREIYDGYLKANRISSKNFENMLEDEMRVNKLSAMLQFESLPFEEDIINVALGFTSNISYHVITKDDIKDSSNEEELKKYWEDTKAQYITNPKYTIEILWTNTDNHTPTDEELSTFYNEYSYNYMNENNTPLSLEESKEMVIKDVQIQETKREAQKAYIAWKNGEINATQSVTLELNDPLLSQEIWEEIANMATSEFTIAKVVDNKYASVKLIEKQNSQIMSFKEAKPFVVKNYNEVSAQRELDALAESILSDPDKLKNGTLTQLTIQSIDTLSPLNHQESLQFIEKLFTTNQEKGIISILDKRVAYQILSQSFNKVENYERVSEETTQLKQAIFENNLINTLDKRYPTKIYVKGLVSE